MALKMPGPVALASGVFHLNIRVPSDLVRKVRGSRVSVPIEGTPVTLKVGDKVVVSLRTRDAAIAKARFTAAAAALAAHWAAVRAGPKTLSHREVVALAGDAYRNRMARFDLDFDPEALERDRRQHAEAVAAWRYGDDEESGEIAPESAAFFAAIQRPMGVQLLALESGGDIVSPFVSITYEKALEELFGAEADALCTARQTVIDEPTRTRLLQEIGRAVKLVGGRLTRYADGDYTPDKNLGRFPIFEPPQNSTPIVPQGPVDKITLQTLFDRWCTHNADKKAASTERRYRPSILSLAQFLKGKDIRQVDSDDVWAWAEYRRDNDKIAARTINRNDLVAAASLFNFAATRDSDAKKSGEKKRPLRSDNPVRGVKLDEPRAVGKKDKVFKAEDIKAILTLTRSVEIDPLYPKASASRRWAPWICAYSGARIQEVCWLKKENVWQEAGIWVMEFPMTKDGFARTVPLHDALIEEGLVEFWKSCGAGFLFVGDRPSSRPTKMTAQELRAGDLAGWIRKHVSLDPHLSPNHSWRHTFITKADGRMTKRMANRLAGHNKKKDASDGYYSPSIDEMKASLDAYPKYVF